MIKNEWVEMEIEAISKQRKKRKPNLDNIMFVKLFLMITAVFFCSPVLDAKPRVAHRYGVSYTEGGGVCFTCRHCRTAQWQDISNTDWRGYFYCVACKKRAD